MSDKTTFVKAQVSAFFGGIIDYCIMVLFTDIFKIHYTISILIGGIIGSIFNFSINRYWSFSSTEKPIGKQLTQFYIMVTGSILLKSSGSFMVTSIFVLNYKLSRIIVDLFVSIGFNYFLQRNWVFKKKANIEI